MSDIYRLNTGLNYKPNGDESADEVRREPGDVVGDLNPASIGWLLEGGLITPAPGATVTIPAAAEDEDYKPTPIRPKGA